MLTLKKTLKVKETADREGQMEIKAKISEIKKSEGDEQFNYTQVECVIKTGTPNKEAITKAFNKAMDELFSNS